jgi:hypothetical protein
MIIKDDLSRKTTQCRTQRRVKPPAPLSSKESRFPTPPFVRRFLPSARCIITPPAPYSCQYMCALQLLHQRLRSLGSRAREPRRMRQGAVDNLLGQLDHVNVVAVHVEPGAADDEGDVLREVEGGGDEGEADEEEEECVCWTRSVSMGAVTFFWEVE